MNAKRVTLTVIDSCGYIHAEIVYAGEIPGQVGNYVSLPSGKSGTLIRAELIMVASADSTVDSTRP